MSWVFLGVPGELVNMVSKMFTRKSEEGVTESDLGSTRYAPKITVEEYNNTRIDMDTQLQTHIQPSLHTVITSNYSLKNENSKAVNDILQQKSTKKGKNKAIPPRLNLSPDSYATNIYCQVNKSVKG